MKLKYLFLSVCMAGFFTACSTDEIPTPGPNGGGEEVKNVSLSMGVNEGGAVTKATVEGYDYERQIKRLTLIAMNTNGKVYVKEEFAKTGVVADNFVGDLEVPAGTYDILIVANAAVVTGQDYTTLSLIKTKADVLAYMENLSQQKSDAMLMTSELYTGVNLQAEDKAEFTYHYLYNNGSTFVRSTKNFSKAEVQDRGKQAYEQSGAKKVKLTRQMARIDITGLTFEPATEYKNATFKLEKIYIANARNNTLIYSAADAEGYYNFEVTTPPTTDGFDYYRGGSVEDFLKYNNWISPNSEITSSYNYVKNYTKGAVASGPLLGTGDTFSCYVFENHAKRIGDTDVLRVANADKLANNMYDTRVVIEGLFEADTYPFKKTRFYHIPIRDKNEQSAIEAGHWGVRRNHIYKVSGTIKGIGWPGEDGGDEEHIYINSVIEVASWNVIDIDDNL